MTEVSLLGCVDQCRLLVRDIENIHGGPKTTSETFIKLQNTTHHLDSIDQHAIVWSTTSTWTPPALSMFFQDLAKHAYAALVQETEYFSGLMQVLALRSRTVEWTRKRFGVITDAVNGLEAPTSVLEVARLTCTLKYVTESSAIEAALRIINNCCSEEDDTNRSAFVQHDGIEILLNLALHKTNLNLLVPTLHTVCTDHGVPSTVLLPPSAYLGADAVAQDGEVDDEQPSLAVEKLAAAHRLTNNFTTFELLLSLQSKVDEVIQPYLIELVELATRPALSGFQHIREYEGVDMDPWCFCCIIGEQEYDTVTLINTLASSDIENILPISRVVLNLMSQQPVRDAVLRRQDESLLSLLTIACVHESDYQLSSNDKEELVLLRKAFLKILYQVSGSEDFLHSEVRSPILIAKCIDQMEKYVDTDESEIPCWSTNDFGVEHPSNFIAASACVILAQLAGSKFSTSDLLVNKRLSSILIALFRAENRPDILYPALIIVSRTSQTTEQDLAFSEDNGLQSIQRLLTQKGLGLIVPFEAVAVFKTAIRGRPRTIEALLTSGQSNTSVMDDMFQLWSLTFEAGIKLEISKFFIEVLRTILPEINAQDRHQDPSSSPLLLSFRDFLIHSATRVAQVFAWMCLAAEPVSQRDNGWFGLAMLSTWTEARTGILETIESQQELRDAILQLSQLDGGPVKGNLMLMLSKLLEDPEFGRSGIAEETLGTVAMNLGLDQLSRG